MEEDNKYWLEEEERKCLFCGNGRDRIKHFVKECRITKEWFRKLGNSDDGRIKKTMERWIGERERWSTEEIVEGEEKEIEWEEGGDDRMTERRTR